MRMAGHLLLTLAVATIALLGFARADAGQSHGTITGVVFDDFDRDGMQDEGEPGLGGQAVILKQEGAFLSYLSTDSQGRYIADGLEPGAYTLNPDFNDYVGACPLLAFSFNPLQRGYCQDFALPRSADPAGPVLAVVAGGMTVEINFGSQPADAAVVTGVALLEHDVAPQGASIVAYVNGQECGSTTSSGSRREANFIIDVLGAGERAGCAARGDAVEFRVDDVPAAGSYQWVPYTDASFPLQTHHIVAIQDHAWYWFERGTGRLPADSINVRALVDGVDCGGAGIGHGRGGTAVVGFSRLIVPSAELEPGCGRPGATVSFLIDGLESETTLAWERGLQRIDLTLSGDVDCDLERSAIDAVLILQLSAGLLRELVCQDAADVDRDGAVDSIDAALILQLEVGLIESLPALRR